MGCIVSTCQPDGSWVTVDTRTPADLIAAAEYEAERFDAAGDRALASYYRGKAATLRATPAVFAAETARTMDQLRVLNAAIDMVMR